MFEFLRSIDLFPLEWEQAVSLTDNASPYIGQVLDTAFDKAQAVIVLLTPDEVAYLLPEFAAPNDPEIQPKTQARPNVLFEAGMTIGRDSAHTVIVQIGSLRPFSDISGRHIIRLDNSSERRSAFADRLHTAGCEVDKSGTDWLKSGNFTSPNVPNLPLGKRVPSMQKVPATVEFDLKYYNLGGNKLDKLQVINRGTETIYNVNISVPNDAGLKLKGVSDLPIKKIPGHGKSVTIFVLNIARMTMSSAEESFDVEITGNLESGKIVKQSVFIDLN